MYTFYTLAKGTTECWSSKAYVHIELRVEALSATVNKFYLLPLQFLPDASLFKSIVKLSPIVQIVPDERMLTRSSDINLY